MRWRPVGARNVSAMFLCLAIMSVHSVALGQTACPQFFAGGQAPAVINSNLAPKYRELCNTGYAVGHSGLTRGPLWGAELLTKQDLDEGRGVARQDNFRTDERLPTSERAELRDYARSGYDRGHIVNSRDLPPGKRDESFLLSNIIPQDSEGNRGIWSSIESATRYEAKRRGHVYVITGPLFQGQSLQSLKGKVAIPTGLFKCIYDATRQQAGCYVIANSAGFQYNIASVAEVEMVVGINLFPAMPSKTKSTPTNFAVPRERP